MAVLLDSGFLFASLNVSEAKHQSTILVLKGQTNAARVSRGGKGFEFKVQKNLRPDFSFAVLSQIG